MQDVPSGGLHEKARTEIEESDYRREKFIQTMTGSDWYDARNYHLSLDSHAVGLEASADLIIALVEKMQWEMNM
ncbi:MAG TPA: cytidylate kinase family protein [Nitrospirota bacterium]|nr:cytidylate kinase family protein [Nitrospirota bacterium]